MIKVTVPATSANLGSGFDSLGVALSLHNTVYMEEWDGADIASLDGTAVPCGKNNLIYSSARMLYERCGKSFKGLRIRQINDIPMTRGLGSSSACVVAGLAGANALLDGPLDTGELVNLAATIEGHPDNSTPAILGGFAAAVLEEGRVYCTRLPIEHFVEFAAFIPSFSLKTSVARAALPDSIPFADAVYNLSRSALMAACIGSGDIHSLRVAARDRLHQQYRMGLIPGGKEIFDAAERAGALAVFVSGAGPTVLAMVEKGDTEFYVKAEKLIKGLNFKLHAFSGCDSGASCAAVADIGE